MRKVPSFARAGRPHFTASPPTPPCIDTEEGGGGGGGGDGGGGGGDGGGGGGGSAGGGAAEAPQLRKCKLLPLAGGWVRLARHGGGAAGGAGGDMSTSPPPAAAAAAAAAAPAFFELHLPQAETLGSECIHQFIHWRAALNPAGGDGVSLVGAVRVGPHDLGPRLAEMRRD